MKAVVVTLMCLASFSFGAIFQNYLDSREYSRACTQLTQAQLEYYQYWDTVSSLSLDVLCEIHDSCDAQFFYDMVDLESFKSLRYYMETNGCEDIECFIGEWEEDNK